MKFNIFKKDKKYKVAEFDDYSKYVDIQHRSDPKEFMDPRLQIVSSFVFLLPILKKLNISDVKVDEEGITKGHLKGDDIKILDAGTRDGWTVEFLNSLGYNNVLGIELFDDYIQYAKDKNRNVEKGDLHNLSYEENTFDFVYCRHTLEHTLDPVKAMNEMLRVTKVGGAMYCSFPLEQNTQGKHTVAFPDPETVKSIVSSLDYKYDVVYMDRAVGTNIVIPDTDEYIVFLQKKA